MQARQYHLMFDVEEEHWWFKSKRKLIESIIQRFGLRSDTKSSQILDFGCGTGVVAKQFKEMGVITCVDCSPLAIEFCKQRGLTELHLIDFEAPQVPGGPYDGIFLLDVLYHNWIRDEGAILQTIKQKMKKGAWILITDSAMPILRSEHDKAVMGRVRYTKTALRKLVQDTGFEIIYINHWNALLFPLVFFQRKVLNRFAKNSSKLTVGRVNPVLDWILYQILRFEIYLSRVIKFPFGSSLICLCRKKD